MPQDRTSDRTPDLAPQHARLIDDSAIAPDVALTRGYRTVTTRAALRELGFGSRQLRVPALLVPVWNVHGEVVLHQLRPDTPRVVDGKPLKYETPAGARMALDVPPAARSSLGDPARPLFITEGARKADAAVSRGLCCVALLGVWNWRGSNAQGGKLALADWDSIALAGRKVYVAFDSDVCEKKPVRTALSRLGRFLESRGAEVLFIYLPPAEGGAKVGLDDFFAAGGTVEELLRHAESALRPPPGEGCPYSADEHGLTWHRPGPDGSSPVRLCNFTAEIRADTLLDDGLGVGQHDGFAETRREFELEAHLHGRKSTFRVPAAQFPTLSWVSQHLGAEAILFPGNSVREHARCALQLLSKDIERRTVFTHTGWRRVDGEWVYLHAGGAIGKAGPVRGIEVSLQGALAGLELPAPPLPCEKRELAALAAAELKLLDVAPDLVTVPLLSAVFRAALGSCDFTVHLAGPSGAGKTELAALAQQHFGAGLNARRLPASWSSTGNALEGIAFEAKDSLLVVDDFAPCGSVQDVQKLHREADRILRAQGNRSGRQRMRPDGTLRETKPPRTLILSTGEDTPRGKSLRARMVALEVEPGAVRWDAMTACQEAANDGGYARMLAAFVRWVAQERAELRFGGRDMRLTDVHGKVIPEIVGT